MDIFKYRDIARNTPGTSIDAPGEPFYAVRTKLANPEPGEWYWHLCLFHMLTGAENVGKQNLFVEVLDENGAFLRCPWSAIGWTWEGRGPNEPAPPLKLEKPADEPGGDIGIYWGQRIEAWVILDGLKSDRISDVHTMWPDGETGNTRGHFSGLAVWQKRRFAGVEPEPEPTPEPVPGADHAPELAAEVALWLTSLEMTMAQKYDELEELLKRYGG